MPFWLKVHWLSVFLALSLPASFLGDAGLLYQAVTTWATRTPRSLRACLQPRNAHSKKKNEPWAAWVAYITTVLLLLIFKFLMFVCALELFGCTHKRMLHMT